MIYKICQITPSLIRSQCAECGAKFSDPGNLKRHISAAHTKKIQTDRNGSTIGFDANTHKGSFQKQAEKLKNREMKDDEG